MNCPDRQYEPFCPELAEGTDFWLHITKQKPGTSQEHELSILMTVLVCERVNGK